MLRESKELPKQNQHFIPRSFLNEFTSNSEGWFHELNIATKYLRKIHINNVCKIENFYDINDEAFLKRYKIDNPRYLEHSFTYENSLRKILTKIRNKEHYLDRTEFQTMVEAYVSLKHRTFYFRKQFGNNELTGQIIDSVVETFKVENQDLIKSHKFNYDEFVEKFKYKTLNDKERPKTHHLFGLLESSKNQNNPVMDAIVKILSMNIIIIESPEQDYFLVSDNPGYSLFKDKMFNTNFGKFDKIYFPINSKQMILFHGSDLTNYINPLVRLTYIKVPSSFVSEVNRLTKLIADEKLFCEDKDYLARFKNSL